MNYCNWKLTHAKGTLKQQIHQRKRVIFRVYCSRQRKNKPFSIVLIRYLHAVEQILYTNFNGKP